MIQNKISDDTNWIFKIFKLQLFNNWQAYLRVREYVGILAQRQYSTVKLTLPPGHNGTINQNLHISLKVCPAQLLCNIFNQAFWKYHYNT
jgi:hypothetical protein